MTGRDLVGLACPSCGALVPDPGRLAARDQVTCRYCRQSFVIDHTAGSRVCAVVPHAAFVTPARQRIEQLGFRPGDAWTRASFPGWRPGNQRDALLIAACVQFGPPFAAAHWASTLTRTWPELVDTIGDRRHGQIAAMSASGNPIVIVFGQTEYDLRAAIAEAKLDAASAARGALTGTKPPEAAIVAPNHAIEQLTKIRLMTLKTRFGPVFGRDFAGWSPPDPTHALVVAVCAQFGPPFSALHWHDYLGRSWPELVDTVGQRGRGQLEARSPSGARVVVVFGQTEPDLRAAIDAMQW